MNEDRQQELKYSRKILKLKLSKNWERKKAKLRKQNRPHIKGMSAEDELMFKAQFGRFPWDYFKI